MENGRRGAHLRQKGVQQLEQCAAGADGPDVCAGRRRIVASMLRGCEACRICAQLHPLITSIYPAAWGLHADMPVCKRGKAEDTTVSTTLPGG